MKKKNKHVRSFWGNLARPFVTCWEKTKTLFPKLTDVFAKIPTKMKALGVHRCLLILIGIVVCISFFNIGKEIYNYWQSEKLYDEVQNMYASKDDVLLEWGVSLPDVDFESLVAQNDDIIAWIYISNTNISFPVLKGKTNKQYLFQSYKKKYLTAGSIYIDYRCRRSFSDKNTVIYGHNMHDGNMFGKLKKYADQDYMEKHQYIYIMRANGNINRYEIFAYFRASIEGEVYNLPLQKDGSEDQFNALKYEINTNNTYTGYAAEEEDTNYITLSTCTQDSRNDVRVCVIARLIGTIRS